MRLKYPLAIILLVLPFLCLAQKDSGLNHSDNTEWMGIKGNLYFSGGIGASTILLNIYGWDAGGKQGNPQGISQSIVYNGAIDYGLGKIFAIGSGVAYQTATGYPQGGTFTTAREYLTRLNISVRFLFNGVLSKHTEVYTGIRIGGSFWTDKVTPTTSPNPYTPPLSLEAPAFTRFPSVQVVEGLRFLEGPIGLHFELGLGTPYLYEAGLTFKIDIKKQNT
jgi:hypothetical protein